MKIAFPTDDGRTISPHFGKAGQYVVVDVSGGALTTEQRSKAHHGAGQDHGPGHTHDDMFAPIQDCQLLIVGGMGTPAHQAAVAHGFQVVATGLTDITAALQAYLGGTLQDEPRRIHAPGAH